MKLKIKENLKQFNYAITTSEHIGLETKLIFEPTKLTLFASNGGTGAKTIFKKEFFDEYEIIGDKEEYGIMLSDLKKILRITKKELTISQIDNRLEIIGDNNKFKMPILEDIDVINALPPVKYTYSKKLKMSQITDVLTKLQSLGSDAMKFYVEDGKLKTKTVNGLRELEIPLIDSEEFKGDIFIGMIHLKSLIPIDNEVTIYLKEDKPLMITMDTDKTNMVIMIAPQVERGF